VDELVARIEREIEAIRACPHCDPKGPHDSGRIIALQWVLAQLRGLPWPQFEVH
jgi:hypothetical protein